MDTQTAYITLIKETCCHKGCGVTFGLAQGHQESLRQSRGWFYCPNGHTQHYTGKTHEEQLAEEKEKTTRERERFEAERAERLKQESAKNRAQATARNIKRRIRNGVCPDCNRTFQNLRRHMVCKHSAKGD